jgi:hypothetical protein
MMRKPSRRLLPCRKSRGLIRRRGFTSNNKMLPRLLAMLQLQQSLFLRESRKMLSRFETKELLQLL